jgi:serine/threonine-protein kinase
MISWTSDLRLGPYELVTPIGTGGMGEVWKARDTRLDRFVAVKRLLSPSLPRFEIEARAIASLNHPHICQIYDVGPDYLVLEYVNGRPLQGPLAADAAVRLARQVANALEAAHAKGILHRDLKPSNVLVTEDGTAKLLDFGVAKLVSADRDATRTQDGTVVGTAAYMSPEQAQGQPIDVRSEVFSFGAVLYELLAGRRAFEGPSTAAVLSAVLRDEPPPFAAPTALDVIVRRCLHKDPARRFPTMTAVRAALDETAVGRPPSKQQSIAVLPFENLSADPENEYFGDGLAEEVINLLVQTPGLKVIARTSAFAFKGKQEDIRRIAEILDVGHVLEGSVRKAGNRIRVTAQLISAGDGSHLWSKRFDRELADVFAIQDEIAQAIAANLHQTFGGGTASPRRPTQSLPAYEALLRARYYALGKADFGRSLASLEEAIAMDPEFALAHSRLGMLFLMRLTAQAMPAHDAAPLARRHAQQALEIEASLPEAHSTLGSIAAMYDYDWAEADRRFRLAFAQQIPSHEVRTTRANLYLAHAARGREAVADMEQAVAEDPLSWGASWALAVAYRSVGRDAEADTRYAQLADIGPWSAVPAVVLSGNHLARGQIHEALAFAETAYARNPVLPAGIGQLAGMQARTGNHERSQALVNQLLPGTTFGAPFGLALYYLASGDLDRCADWLEKAIEQRDPWVSFLLNVGNIGGRVMWSNPRWPRLAQLMNVTPERPMT